jgi:hypothetical protein
MSQPAPRYFAPWFIGVLIALPLLIWTTLLVGGSGFIEPMGFTVVTLAVILISRWVYIDAVAHGMNAAVWSLLVLLLTPLVVLVYLGMRRNRRPPKTQAIAS